MIESWYPYARTVVKGWNQDVPFSREDMVQEAILRLWLALPRFDDSKGNIQAFCKYRIKMAIIDFMRQQLKTHKNNRHRVEFVSLETLNEETGYCQRAFV